MNSRQIPMLAVARIARGASVSISVSVSVLLSVLAHADNCHAQEKASTAATARAPAKGAGGFEPKQAQPDRVLAPDVARSLKSNDYAQIRAALDEVRTVGKGAQSAPSQSVVPLLIDLLKRGLNVPLAEATLDTLGDVEGESASETIAWHARHQSPVVRRAAVRALGHTKGPFAVKALERALSDSDSAVRASAASSLGSLKAHDALRSLYSALEHKVVEAAASIGQLCREDECEALAAKLGALPFDVVTSGLDQVLFRPGAEVSDDAKVKVIGRVRELGTPEAHAFLRDVKKRGTTFSPRLKQALDPGTVATGGQK
jgi:hypothetical protein